MAIDPELTRRLRESLGHDLPLTSKRMMGGECFLLGGHLVASANHEKSGLRRFMFRIGPDNEARESLGTAAPMLMQGRIMRGYWLVDADIVDDAALAAWAQAALQFVAGLPPSG